MAKNRVNLNIASKIDATLLRTDGNEKDVRELCSLAEKSGAKTVCLNPCWVWLAKSLLKNSKCGVCSVAGFPLGAQTTAVKAEEIRDSIKNGADEIDAVINVGYLKSGLYKHVTGELKELRRSAGTKVLKIIIEAPLLTHSEIRKAARMVKRSGADFVKTSTGFFGEPVGPAVVKMIRKAVGKNIGIKAAGGIKTFEDACSMISAGADRIGTSSLKNILKYRRR